MGLSLRDIRDCSLLDSLDALVHGGGYSLWRSNIGSRFPRHADATSSLDLGRRKVHVWDLIQHFIRHDGLMRTCHLHEVTVTSAALAHCALQSTVPTTSTTPHLPGARASSALRRLLLPIHLVMSLTAATTATTLVLSVSTTSSVGELGDIYYSPLV